jgi:hypothetical protein
MRAGSFDEWWARTAALAGPLTKLLACLPVDAMQAVRTRLRAAVDGYLMPTGLELPGLTLIAGGRTPG